MRTRTAAWLLALLVPCHAAMAGAVCAAGDDSADARLQAGLLKALTFSPAHPARVPPSGPAIRAYIDAGFVARRPDARVDYSDYRPLKKPARFLGHRLVLIEEEYRSAYVGCCVSPGVSLVLQALPGTDPGPLKAFATRNRCGLEPRTVTAAGAKDEIVPLPPGAYLELTCKARDRGID